MKKSEMATNSSRVRKVRKRKKEKIFLSIKIIASRNQAVAMEFETIKPPQIAKSGEIATINEAKKIFKLSNLKNFKKKKVRTGRDDEKIVEMKNAECSRF
ncbi:MAG: hypothetical protein Fur0024_1720 [Patescibacteria group bacterium]